VGKIKTRSYVDKDGATKYITEILGDMMLVLEKKQSATGYRSEDVVQNVINEAAGAYNIESKTQTDDSLSGNDDFPDGNEDDLPF
jgi:single-stranded DNA-binding protein